MDGLAPPLSRAHHDGAAVAGELGGDDVNVPVRRQLSLRVQIVKAARGEGREVLPQQSLVLGPIQSLDHSLAGLARRALSCSITFSSAWVKGTVSEDVG